jgi:1-acyl-sn-glycerol-3-phosphate acyltransferase
VSYKPWEPITFAYATFQLGVDRRVSLTIVGLPVIALNALLIREAMICRSITGQYPRITPHTDDFVEGCQVHYMRTLVFKVIWVVWTILFLFPIPILIFFDRTKTKTKMLAKLYCKGFLILCDFILNLKYETRGLTQKHKFGSVIFAAKHQSVWETLALYALLSDVRPILKSELLQIPIFGWYLRQMRLIAVNRDQGRKALIDMFEAAKQVADTGDSLLIFPEGTRQRPYQNSELKGGVFFLYKRLGLQVIPVALNSGVFWPRGAKVIYSGVITISFLDPIDPGQNRVDFMENLHATLSEKSDDLVKELDVDDCLFAIG